MSSTVSASIQSALEPLQTGAAREGTAVSERATMTINTAAAGGNATLLAEGD